MKLTYPDSSDVKKWYAEYYKNREKWVIRRNVREVLYEKWGDDWYMLEFETEQDADDFIEACK